MSGRECGDVMYVMRRDKKMEYALTPEELDVRRALGLAGYTVLDDPTVDFVPTRTLYGAYRTYYVRQPGEWDSPELLTPQQFGHALRRVFEPLDDSSRNARCQYAGRRVKGYLGVIGPGSIRVHGMQGRPPKSRHDSL